MSFVGGGSPSAESVLACSILKKTEEVLELNEELKKEMLTEENVTALTELLSLFKNVDDDPKVKIDLFLKIFQGVFALMDRFGKVFAPILYDMNKNIENIEFKLLTLKNASEYIEDLVLDEQNNEELLFTNAVQWLRRSLHFITKFLKLVLESCDSQYGMDELSFYFKKAYEETMEPYHGWLGTQLFNVMSRFTPSKGCLFYTLALNKHNKEEFVLKDIRLFTEEAEKYIDKIQKFYDENNLEGQVLI